MKGYDCMLPARPGRLRESWHNLWAILWNPSEVFDRLRENPSYLLPLVFVAFGGILLEMDTRPMIELLLVRTAPKDIPVEQLQQGLVYFKKMHFFGLIASPLLLLLKWAATALLLFLITVLIEGRGTYRKALSLVSFSSVILLLQAWYSRMIVHLKGMEALKSPWDLDPPIGLSLLLPGLNPGWSTFFNTFNLFEVWFVFLLILGLSSMENISRKKAAMAVIPLWLLLTGLRAGLAAWSGNAG